MAKGFTTTAVIEKGVLKMRNRPKLEAWAKQQRDGEYTMTLERHVAIRNLEQNALYWAGFVKPLADEFGWTQNDMHAYLRQRFLPAHKRHVKHLALVNRRTGEYVDEMEIDLSTTTTLNKVEFSEYLRDIQVWAGEQGVEVGSNRESAA